MEVAQRAGVSLSTVSLVLADKAVDRRISADTTAKVRRAAEELNYAPNLLTRSLRRGRTHILSFFSTFRHREWGDLYMDRISAAIETAGGEYGYDVLIHTNFARSIRETYQVLNGGIADGLILFAPTPEDELLALLRRSRLPVVILNGRDPLGQFSSVRDDVASGMARVAEELFAHGHRRIAVIASDGADVRDSDLRVRLLRENLQRLGLDLPEDRVAVVNKNPLKALRALWERKDAPTAIFCWHDWLAYRVLEACQALEIQVPDQLSIIGYDGLHWPSVASHIATSIEVDVRAVADCAVRLLDKSIQGPVHLLSEEVVPVTFRPGTTLSRASTGAL
ncbi:MAG: LacI family DNA-binding transcriptional regulator [Fimbriimonas sp.]